MSSSGDPAEEAPVDEERQNTEPAEKSEESEVSDESALRVGDVVLATLHGRRWVKCTVSRTTSVSPFVELDGGFGTWSAIIPTDVRERSAGFRFNGDVSAADMKAVTRTSLTSTEMAAAERTGVLSREEVAHFYGRKRYHETHRSYSNAEATYAKGLSEYAEAKLRVLAAVKPSFSESLVEILRRELEEERGSRSKAGAAEGAAARESVGVDEKTPEKTLEARERELEARERELEARERAFDARPSETMTAEPALLDGGRGRAEEAVDAAVDKSAGTRDDAEAADDDDVTATAVVALAERQKMREAEESFCVEVRAVVGLRSGRDDFSLKTLRGVEDSLDHAATRLGPIQYQRGVCIEDYERVLSARRRRSCSTKHVFVKIFDQRVRPSGVLKTKGGATVAEYRCVSNLSTPTTGSMKKQEWERSVEWSAELRRRSLVELQEDGDRSVSGWFLFEILGSGSARRPASPKRPASLKRPALLRLGGGPPQKRRRRSTRTAVVG